MKGKEGSPTLAEKERKSEAPKQSVAQREEEGRLHLLVRKLDTLKRQMLFQMVFRMAAAGEDVVTVNETAGLNQALVSQLYCETVCRRTRKRNRRRTWQMNRRPGGRIYARLPEQRGNWRARYSVCWRIWKEELPASGVGRVGGMTGPP